MKCSLLLLVVIATVLSSSPPVMSKKCKRDVKRYGKCLKAGFQSSLGCDSGEGTVKGRKLKICTKREKKAAACGNTCAPPPPPRSWKKSPGKYLSGYSSGTAKYASLETAQAECLTRSDCGGITYETYSDQFTLRQGVDLRDSPSEEVSWMSVLECRDSGDSAGVNYRGTVAVTVSGNKCQNWDSQSPNEHSRTAANYPNSGLEANYCRNPDGESGAWCYNDGGTSPRWELCDIPTC